MMDFTQRQKAKFILYKFERDGSDAEDTPRERMAAQLKIGRTKLYLLLSGKEDLKDPESVEALNKAFAELVARPGGEPHRALFARVESAIKARDKTMMEQFLLNAALDTWGPRALDGSRDKGARLLDGSLAEFVLHNGLKLVPDRGPGGLVQRTHEEIRQWGTRVMEVVADILRRHPEPPPGFFGSGNDAPNPQAREAGWKVFKIRMQSDEVGWKSEGLMKDAAARAELFTRAFETGLHLDLLWLHSIIGENQISWINNAWNLAMHAGDWRQSVQIAAVLFADFPDFLTRDTMTLESVTADPTVWPGIAAIMLDREHSGLETIRRRTSNGGTDFETMMRAVRRMMPGVAAGKDYVAVFEMGEAK
jgi:hypothetical protein